MKTQKSIYLEGLTSRNPKHVGFSPSGATGPEEDAYAELNRMHAASDNPDPAVLGKYSP